MIDIPAKYIKRAGLEVSISTYAVVQSLKWLRTELISTKKYGQNNNEDFYTYRVPKLSENGSCSLIKELDPKAYDLSIALGGKNPKNDAYLLKIRRVLTFVNDAINAEWIGIYGKFESYNRIKLVKLSYIGIPSRAEFPLNKEFAEHSNNSAVGLTGKAIIINDLVSHKKQGKAYYECDPKVRSEICLPVFDSNGSVIGIVDAESHEIDFFTKQKITKLIATCIVLKDILSARN